MYMPTACVPLLASHKGHRNGSECSVQEVQLLRTELTNRILSLQEQFEMDLSDLLQRGDIGVDTGTICGVLSKKKV
jgi:hypothetical protein